MLDRPPSGSKPLPSTRREALRRLRDARHRRRLKQGLAVVPVEVSADVVNWLLRIHWLSEDKADSGDARLIGARLAAGLAASAKGS